MSRDFRKWSEDEENFLINNYTNMTDEELGEKLLRTKVAIERKRAKLNLKKNEKLKLDTQTINEIISSKLTYQEIAEKFNITREQARGIFRKYAPEKYIAHTKQWSIEEERFLISNYKTKGDLTIAQLLNRTVDSILKKRIKLGLHRKNYHIVDNRPDKHWTEEEDELLISNIDKLTYEEISQKLKRSIKAVMVRASRLGIIAGGSKWSLKEDQILREYSKHPIEVIAFMLERSPKAIKYRLSTLGIDRYKSNESTSLEKKIESVLIDLGVNFQKQVVLGSAFNYRADFVIGKIVLEAHGDYWHGNPILFPNPNHMQSYAIEKDRLKRSYFEELGYKVYEIWEYDVNNDFSRVKKRIARLLGNQ